MIKYFGIKKILNEVIFLYQHANKNNSREFFLSYLWILLTPLTIMFFWGFMKSVKVINIPDLEVPYLFFVLYNYIIFIFFKETINLPRSLIIGFIANSKKYKFQFASEFIYRIISLFRDFIIRLFLLLVVREYFDIESDLWMIEVFGILLLFLFSLGLGFVIAPILICVSDVSKLWGILLPYSLFVSPILYPIPIDPTGFFNFVFYNPLTYYFGLIQSSYMEIALDFKYIITFLSTITLIFLIIFIAYYRKRILLLD